MKKNRLTNIAKNGTKEIYVAPQMCLFQVEFENILAGSKPDDVKNDDNTTTVPGEIGIEAEDDL